jgi:hypothetical protein
MERTFTFEHKPLVYSSEAKVTPSQVDQVYFGQLNCCACGCAGDYFDDEAHIIKALEALENGRNIESIDDYIFDVACNKKGSKTFGIRVYLKKNN